jgi:hypothetical protein
LITPDPETTQQDLKKLNPQGNAKKNLIELLNTKYPDFNYTEWVTEYKNALEKSLTTGIEILGLFIYSQSVDHKNQSSKKIVSLMNLLFTPDEEEVNEDGEIQVKEKHFKPFYHEQYFVVSVYNQKLN